MSIKKFLLSQVALVFFIHPLFAQVIINEGSNRNYSLLADEEGEFPDWIELYNSSNDTVNLLNYSLTDNISNPVKWTLPNIKLAPGEFRTVFCSGKDRKPVSGFVHVVNTGTFNAVVGWNTHALTTPFYWDGISNILINTCSYYSNGYTTNSVFNQSFTTFLSTVFAFQDGSPAACSSAYGNMVYQRPNMKLNGLIIGTGVVQNSPYDYPAPYGNWYWGARHQMLILGSELVAAGLTEGDISSIAFDVAATDPNTTYDYIDIHMKLVTVDHVSSLFEIVDPNNNLHTNFKISETGETVYLYSPGQILLSQLHVECDNLDNSRGYYPDASPVAYFFGTGTPGSTNNNSPVYYGYLLQPTFSVPSGFYDLSVSVYISNPNTEPSSIYYTLDGNDPTVNSNLFNGTPVTISGSTVLKSRAIGSDYLPSPIAVSSYFFGVEHTTPIVSVVTDHANLYGPNGIFDNWWYDWEKSAYVEYFDSTQQLIFSQAAGIQIDGGAGGSRSNPQHSFRVELDDGVLGAGPIDYPLIPFRPERTQYGKFFLRNGSNQYLVFPQKDACQVESLGGETNNYYSGWRPVSVYINGSYFGLYELREKFDSEYFGTLEGADPDSMDILSVSYWYGGILRAVTGSVDPFYDAYEDFNDLNPDDTAYWDLADNYFDMAWYTDYIIAESWIANVDWPWNNIKIYRSDQTGYRWRFCIIDVELALAPNGWSDCYSDHIQYLLSQDPNIPYVNIWLQSIQNDRFRDYFINRYADVMNTSYRSDRILAIENNFYDLVVPEMSNEYARWGDPYNIEGQMAAFYDNHLVFRDQFSERSTQVRNHIQSNFALPNQVDVTLNVFPTGSGQIKISTITPDTYPWEGVYFNGVPVRIEAIAGPGYYFLHWGDNGLITDTFNAVFLDTLEATSISFEAYFELNYISVATSSEPAEGGTTTGDGSYPEGSEVTVVAFNNEGYRFEYWMEEDTVVSYESHYSFFIYNDRVFVAVFSPLVQYAITTVSNPVEGGSTTGSGNYYEDSLATVIATPFELWEFISWTEEGSIVAEDSAYSFYVSGDRDLVANFIPILSISDFNDAGMMAYPNPATGNARIMIPLDHKQGADEIILINMNGQVLFKTIELSQPELLIPVSRFPAGLYLLQWRRSGMVLGKQRLIIR